MYTSVYRKLSGIERNYIVRKEWSKFTKWLCFVLMLSIFGLGYVLGGKFGYEIIIFIIISMISVLVISYLSFALYVFGFSAFEAVIGEQENGCYMLYDTDGNYLGYCKVPENFTIGKSVKILINGSKFFIMGG